MSLRFRIDLDELRAKVDGQQQVIDALLERVAKLENDRTLRLKPKESERGR